MNDSKENSNPLILAIETATRAGSVAVAQGREVLASRDGDPTISHSTNLIEMIEAVLTEAGAELSDVDFFAVAVGPGSFTGLRIGLATVKGFAAVTGQPIVGVSTLAAIARSRKASGEIVSLLPAGRGEVFAQMFSLRNGDVISLDDAAHLTPKDTWQRYGDRVDVQWAGEGVQKMTEFGVASEPEAKNESLAASVAILALKDYWEGKSVTADDLHAVYVRASDAEINERWQRHNAQ